MKQLAVAGVFMGFAHLLLGASMSDDQTPTPAPQPAKTNVAPAIKKLPPWWVTSSQENPFLIRWQFHADGTFSYMNSSGNTSGTSFDTSGNAWVRKGRLTSHFVIQLTNKNIAYATTQSTVDYEERTLREQLDYDISPYVTLIAGIEGYRNTLMFLNDRLNIYSGAGSNLFHSEKHKVTFTAAIGHSDFSFDRAAMLRVNADEVTALNTNPASSGALGMQMWRWAASSRFIFVEDASYMQYFDQALGHRWTINLTGTLPVNKWIAFTVNYRVKEETNVFIHALHVFPQDRMFLLGIKVQN
jgi:Protein of unknown function, DUF481